MSFQSSIITPAVVEGFIKGYNRIPPLYRYEAIEEEAAILLGKSDIPLQLDSIKTISPSALRNLAQREDDLCLDSLVELTLSHVEALVNHRGGLSLSGLSEIPPSVLEYLISSPRKFLKLDGLKGLAITEAEIISNFQGYLSLGGISTLGDGSTEYLARHSGHLDLGNLEALTVQQACHLVKHRGDIILKRDLRIPREGAYLLHKCLGKQVSGYLLQHFIEDCLAEGTDEALATVSNSLKTIENTLCLDGLRVLRCNGAKVLSEFTGELQLPSLEELDTETASSLAGHVGSTLAINGLKSLNVTIAKALGRYRGELSLKGLEVFEEGSLNLLALHDGSLTMSLPEGGNDKYGWFKIEDQKVIWKPSGIDHQDLAIVQEIINSDSSEIEIPEEVHFITNTILTRLGYSCRTLGIDVSLPGLTGIDLHQSHLLTRNYLKKIQITCPGMLALNGLIDLNAEVAEELGKSGIDISLSNLSEISPDSFRGLTLKSYDTAQQIPGGDDDGKSGYNSTSSKWLFLNGLRRLPQECAAILSGHRGILELNGLKKLSQAEAKELLRHTGEVMLKGISAGEINSIILHGVADNVFVLAESEIYSLIRSWQTSVNPSKFLSDTDRDDPNTIIQVIRYLIEEISFFVSLGEGVMKNARFDPGSESLPGFPWHDPYNAESMLFVSRQRPSKRKMISDDLFRHVTERYFEVGGDKARHEHDALNFIEKTSNSRHLLRQKGIHKLYGVAGFGYSEYPNYNDTRTNILNFFIKNCSKSARKILCWGLTGKYDISPVHLVTLGCLFASRVDLPEVVRLCEKGAKALSVLDAEIALNGITDLSEEIALILAEHTGTVYELTHDGYEYYKDTTYNVYHDALELNGILSLDSKTATALASHRGSTLRLNGIVTLSDDVAEALALYEGMLELRGLETISPRGVKILSIAIGDKLQLNVADSLSDLLEPENLEINGINEISDQAKDNFPKYENVDSSCYETRVAGVTYENRIDAIRSLSIGEHVLLRRQPENRYDANAILVLTLDSRELGYIPRGIAMLIAGSIDSIGGELPAEVVTVKKGELPDYHFELSISFRIPNDSGDDNTNIT